MSYKEKSAGKAMGRAVSLDCLATTYYLQGHIGRALYREALNIREQINKMEHRYAFQGFRALVDFYSNQGQQDQAELLYQQGLLLREEKLGVVNPHVLEARIPLDMQRVDKQEGGINE